ncbi:MAG: laccase domain-containing protein, partial [Acidimicrobiales bacterium]
MPLTQREARPAAAPLALLRGRVRWTERDEGDLRPGPEGAAALVAAAGPGVGTVSWLRQVHGRGVVVVDGSGPVQGAEGDALVTAQPGAALAVLTADCGPVALASPEGVV